jgi:hypothetical protein
MPGSKYSDGVFGDVRRQWFGLTQKHGGADAVITFNETRAVKITRHYPKGPIKILKFGVYTAATLGKGEELFRLCVNGTTTPPTGGTVVASTTSAPYTIASVACAKQVNAGSYITLLASTNVCSTGSVALFIDYVPVFSNSGKWNRSNSLG